MLKLRVWLLPSAVPMVSSQARVWLVSGRVMVEPLADVVAAVSRPSIFHTQVLPAGRLAEGRV